MDKISISVQSSRKFVFSWIAMLITLSGMVLTTACVQTPAPDPSSQGLTRLDMPVIVSQQPLATQEPDKTSVFLMATESQSNFTTPRPFPTLPEAIVRVEQTPATPVTGEVPASLLEQIIQNLSERLKIRPGKIEIVKAEAVVWNDGSLGCPRPGEFYTQALVNGYWLILEVDAVAYDYHASDRGYFFLCELPSLPGFDSPGKQPPEP